MSVAASNSITFSIKPFPKFAPSKKITADTANKTVTVHLDKIAKEELQNGILWVPILRCKFQHPYKISLDALATPEQKKVLNTFREIFKTE